MSGRRSRSKGKRGEREAAHKMEEVTGLDWRRGLGQSRGGAAEEEPDIVCDALPYLHVEVKRHKRPSIPAAMRQAIEDADARDIPVAMTRADRDEWLVTVRADDLLQLAHQLVHAWGEE